MFAFCMTHLCVHRGRPPHRVPERGVVTDRSRSMGCVPEYTMSNQSPSHYAEAVSHSIFRREVHRKSTSLLVNFFEVLRGLL